MGTPRKNRVPNIPGSNKPKNLNFATILFSNEVFEVTNYFLFFFFLVGLSAPY